MRERKRPPPSHSAVNELVFAVRSLAALTVCFRQMETEHSTARDASVRSTQVPRQAVPQALHVVMRVNNTYETFLGKHRDNSRAHSELRQDRDALNRAAVWRLNAC